MPRAVHTVASRPIDTTPVQMFQVVGMRTACQTAAMTLSSRIGVATK